MLKPFVLTLLLSVLCVLGRGAFAQQVSPQLREYAALQEQVLQLFDHKEYEKAAELLKRQAELRPKSGEPHYNLACAMARLDRKDEAIAELKAAIGLDFTDVAHMRVDDDLASLHGDARFADVLAAARQKQLDAPYEHAAEMPDLKTYEDYPEDGLRYRVRIDAGATPSKPARLVVWLHPSGGSMDDVVEKLAPQLARHGFALMVFPGKDFRFWSAEDAVALGKTLPDLAKIPGLDARRAVLFGYSAGGQMAIMLWQQHPELFGGIVLDAAYPIDMTHYLQTGRPKPMAVPNGDAFKKVPLFVLVGAEDNGATIWSQQQAQWINAGIPLTLHYIPGARHEWLFDGSHIAQLCDWLKEVGAGQLPKDIEAPHRLPMPGEELPKEILDLSRR